MINATPVRPASSDASPAVSQPPSMSPSTSSVVPPAPPAAPPAEIAAGTPAGPRLNKVPSKKFNPKILVGLVVLLVVVVGALAGLFLTQQGQDLRQQAADDLGGATGGLDFCDSNGCNVGSAFGPNCYVNHWTCDRNTDVGNGCQDNLLAQGVQSASFSRSCGTEQIDVFCNGNPLADFVSRVHPTACGAEQPPGDTINCPSPNQCVPLGSATASVACGLSGMEPGSGNCGAGQTCCRPSTYVPQCPWDSSGVGSSCIGDGVFAPQGTCQGGSNNGGNCTLDSHCGGGGRCVGFVPCCPGLTGEGDGVCKCPSGSPPPQPSPSPPTQSACGGPCQTTADCRPAATGVQVVCRNNTCQNLTCPEGQTIPGANCSCGVANLTCGQRCGHGFGLCNSTNGTGSICTFTSGVACSGESQQTYCVGFTNWQVSNPAFTANFCGNTGSGNSYLIRKADNKTSGFTQEEIQSTCAICGDGILHIGEECDEGANNGSETATCDTNCKRKDIVTYACNSTCTTDAQCQTSNPGYVCDPSARTCRLASNPTSTTCEPLAAAACLNISLNVNGQQVAFGADDPVRGDIIQLVCAQAPRAARYIFRVTEPNGQLVILQSVNGSNVSQPYNVTKAGAFKAQCQICTGAANSTCLPFE